MRLPQVLVRLQRNDSIFMIVDIRIAYGAYIIQDEHDVNGGRMDVNVPLSVASVGPDLGAKDGVTRRNYTRTTSYVKRSFCFAYRLR